MSVYDIQSNCTKSGAWDSELLARGYKGPLPAPSPAIQATLASIAPPAIHEYIITQDTAAVQHLDEDGMHAPLFLSTLDLSQWTLILSLAVTRDAEAALEKLREAHLELALLLDLEEAENETTSQQMMEIEMALKKANPQETTLQAYTPSGTSPITLHPLMKGLVVDPLQKAAIEELASSIQSSQLEADMAVLISSGKGPTVPIIPNRTVEFMVGSKEFKCWALPNINLLAPITIPMWKMWANVQSEEMEALKMHAVYNTGHLREGHTIPGAFPLSMFDHHKCGVGKVKVHSKQDLQTGVGRGEKHSSAWWNVQRPYLRCVCPKEATTGCRGDIMWFDHAIFYMINNLGTFFGKEFPTISAKFTAFLTWLTEAAKIGVHHQITFCHARTFMVEAATQYAKEPTSKLLAEYPDAPGLRKIERLIKPPTFSAANPIPLTNTSQNVYGKRTRSSPSNAGSGDSNHYSNASPARSQTRGGRGAYNRKFRTPVSPAQSSRQVNRGSPNAATSAPGPNDAFVYSTSRRGNQGHRATAQIQSLEVHTETPRGTAPCISSTPPDAVGMPAAKKELRNARTTAQGKVLSWDGI